MKDVIVWMHFFVSVMLFFYGFHFYVILALFHRGKRRGANWKRKADIEEQELPVVVIQLPLFNEFNVVARLIEASVGMKYPKDKLEIQVLDDSTDETRELTANICAVYREKGFNISYIHRENRAGYKAGALKEGLEVAQGSLVAIFDADFIPNSDFLMETVPFFLENEKLGLVQTRWDYYNREYSFLTQIQAVALDGHFMVEQKARSDNGLWFNFNGTAGIWRKACIMDAGNWSGDTLTEDLDLSYRAQIKGWKTYYHREIGHESELPMTIPAYKGQQFRWAKGAFQCAKKLLGPIMKAKKTKLSSKMEALVHLINYGAFLFLSLNFLLMLPLSYMAVKYEFNPWDVVPWYLALAFFVLGFMGPFVYFVRSQKERGRRAGRALVNVIGLVILNFGLSPLIVRAFFEAFLGKQSEFVRTPKMNLNTSTEQKTLKRYKIKFDYMILVESLAGIYGLVTILYCVESKLYGIAFFSFLYTFGFFWIVAGTLQSLFSKQNYRLKMKQASTAK